MIKVSYLISYDYEMFLTSVRLVYEHVDKIIGAIDIDNKTWSGNDFIIPDSFYEEVREFDKDNKIEFYKDSFFDSNLSPMENETIERNKVLGKLGYGWKIQLDVDEYIYDFKSIAKYLNKYWYLCLFPKFTPLCIKGKFITLFKELPNGYLFIDNGETYPFITNQKINTIARSNNQIRNINSNISIIHHSWARSEDEMRTKVNNWGHRDDFDTKKYLSYWKSINEKNYKDYKNIHPISPMAWKELFFLHSKTIEEFINNYRKNNPQSLKYIEIKYFINAIFNKFKFF